MERMGTEITKSDNSWKRRALFLGGLLGALTGVGVAYFLVRRAEEQAQEISIGPGEGVRLGLLLLGLLRQVAELGED
jgi:hypothetical protein